MGKPQPAQLIALVFYGFFFFHGTEVRADAYRAFAKPSRHYAYQAGTKDRLVCGARQLGVSSDCGKLLAGPSFRFRLDQRFSVTPARLAAPNDFSLVGAKDFAIRTGLSPPR